MSDGRYIQKIINETRGDWRRDAYRCHQRIRIRHALRCFVHNRLRIQRGQAFVGMLFSTITVVGVWRDSFASIPWWVLVIVGGVIYLALAWLIGYIDDRSKMAKVEQEWYTDRNPQVMEILERVKSIEKKL